MIEYNFLLHFMSDLETLKLYRKRAKWLTNKNLGKDEKKQLRKRFQFYDNEGVCIRNGRLSNCSIPDHIYKSWDRDLLSRVIGREFSDITLSTVFLKILPHVCDELFYMSENGIVAVKEGLWDYWQQLSQSFSPLVLKSIYLCDQKYEKNKRKRLIEKNFRNTALPSSNNEYSGNLIDLHIHWNAGKEADRAVLDILCEPNKYIKEKRTSANYVNFKKKFGESVCEDVYLLALEGDNYLNSVKEQCKENPFHEEDRLMYHAWLLMSVFTRLMSNGKESDFIELHYYLLVLGNLRRLIVLQNNQFGIEQFNYTLKTPFRGPSNYRDGRQIKQIIGNDTKNCSRIEFRISPCQLKSIIDIKNGLKESLKENVRPLIDFVCSVTKAYKKDKSSDYRYSNLIHDLNKTMENDIQPMLTSIVGVDVAGKDFNVGPEAFVDFFKCLRMMNGVRHFTYHAGEDFFHLLSGLRTICEVVFFLDFDYHCRIGHASAAGVDPLKWAWCVKDFIPMRQGEYLDDLIFVCYLINKKNIDCLKRKYKVIKERILELAENIYEKEYSIKELTNAWLNRKRGYKAITEIVTPNTEEQITQRYFQINKNEYEKIIKVECFELFDATDLRILQKVVLQLLVEKDIAIEACPTSNVFIGYDHSLKSYHLKTWLKWKYNGICSIPDIVIGSDEIGTFPTNIANEYACIYEMLKTDKVFNEDTIARIMNDLIKCSTRRAFANTKN